MDVQQTPPTVAYAVGTENSDSLPVMLGLVGLRLMCVYFVLSYASTLVMTLFARGNFSYADGGVASLAVVGFLVPWCVLFVYARPLARQMFSWKSPVRIEGDGSYLIVMITVALGLYLMAQGAMMVLYDLAIYVFENMPSRLGWKNARPGEPFDYSSLVWPGVQLVVGGVLCLRPGWITNPWRKHVRMPATATTSEPQL